MTKISNDVFLDNVSEILGLMEEKGKTKEWILEEISRNKIKPKASLVSNSNKILRSCPALFIKKLLSHLKDEEFDVEDVKTSTKTLHWFFTDMVGSSDPSMSVKAQARKINALNSFIKKTESFKNRDPLSTVLLPTGDGIAIGFSESPEQPLKLAIELHHLLSKYNKSRREKDRVYIRIGIDSGPVYLFKSVDDSTTFWGPGIIMARRVMDLCGQNQIFASSRIADDLRKLSRENKATMHPIGDYFIKHGEQLLIYNIYGKGFGNKTSPKKSKVTKEKLSGNELLKKASFEFNRVEVKLDVVDPKSMLTHHTWIWDVRNVSNLPLEQIFYDLVGDTPKDFASMNVIIRDENNTKLDIMSLDVNKPHQKKFYVKLDKPIRKNQKGRVLKLEYDWEEPERVFEYVFSAKCKQFVYSFSISSDVQIRNRVLEVVRELGLKKRVDPAPKINYKDGKTMISWASDKRLTLEPHDAFEFQW